MKDALIIDQSAVERIKSLREAGNSDFGADSYLRIGIIGGGCSGFKYVMQTEDTVHPDDIVFDDVIVVDDVSLQYMKGSVIGFKDGLMGSSFTIENPKAASSCGCQSSFSVDPDKMAEEAAE